MGIRAASNCEVSYENVRVPAANRFRQRRTGLQDRYEGSGRRTYRYRCSVRRSWLRVHLNEALAYVKERKQFGRPIAAFQTTQFKLADMQTKIDAARLHDLESC